MDADKTQQVRINLYGVPLMVVILDESKDIEVTEVLANALDIFPVLDDNTLETIKTEIKQRIKKS